MQNTPFSTNKTLNINGRLLLLDTPKVMAIVNVTPDSFYSGSRFNTEKEILQQVEKAIGEGASIIDVGGYSSRPKAVDIPLDEEIQRITLAIRAIVKFFPDANISIDTFRSEVAKVAVNEGAGMINDVSGGTLDSAMFETAVSLSVPYVLMHMRGNPQTMTEFVYYENLVGDIINFFQERVYKLTSLGVKDIIIDPGFGFAKTREQNFELLNKLNLFKMVGKPVMAGLSRKSMIWKTLGVKPEDALNGTSALNAVAVFQGVDILRVHDVKECVEVIKLINLVRQSNL